MTMKTDEDMPMPVFNLNDLHQEQPETDSTLANKGEDESCKTEEVTPREKLLVKEPKKAPVSGRKTNYLKGLASKYTPASVPAKSAQTTPKQPNFGKQTRINKEEGMKLSTHSPVLEEKPTLLVAEPIEMTQALYKIEEDDSKIFSKEAVEWS
jgi:hypothetical protein